jgi:hypothetical protein
MSALIARERAEVDRAAEIFSQVEDEIRDFVRRDVNGTWRPSEDGAELTAGNVGWLLQRASAQALQEIDDSIAALKALRHRLEHETARMHHEIVQYASLNEAAQASVRTICENLTFCKQS